MVTKKRRLKESHDRMQENGDEGGGASSGSPVRVILAIVAGILLLL